MRYLFFLCAIALLSTTSLVARDHQSGYGRGGWNQGGNRGYGNNPRNWENRGAYWDWNQGGAANYYYEVDPFDYNSSYYPDYDQYNSPEYIQQPGDADQATFPFHPV